MSTADPILDALLEKAGDMFGSKKAEYDDPYGLGTHKAAVVTEIERIGGTPFGGFRVGVKFNLNGEGMPYTARLDLPEELKQNGDTPDYLVKRMAGRTKLINQLLNHIKPDLSLEKTITNED